MGGTGADAYCICMCVYAYWMISRAWYSGMLLIWLVNERNEREARRAQRKGKGEKNKAMEVRFGYLSNGERSFLVSRFFFSFSRGLANTLKQELLAIILTMFFYQRGSRSLWLKVANYNLYRPNVLSELEGSSYLSSSLGSAKSGGKRHELGGVDGTMMAMGDGG